jgi:predicted DNA-binding protein (MmcQ/YjbR family)
MSHPLTQAVRSFAFGLPGAYEDHPWGESVAKAGGKVFVFFGMPDQERLSFTVKLPESSDDALALRFTRLPGYGLERGRWVSVVEAPHDVPLDLLLGWIEESYRAVAPKRLIAELDARRPDRWRAGLEPMGAARRPRQQRTRPRS